MHTGTFWVFLVPFMVTSFALMFGNWSQHIFVHPDSVQGTGKDRRANFRHSYNVLDSPYNQITFNDGYHVEHHLNSKKHWSELPDSCAKTLQEYEKESALLFRKIDFFIVGILVFTGWWSMLVKYFVDVESPRRSDSAITAMLKSRLAPIKRHDKVA
jgi:fatty acid desaturase